MATNRSVSSAATLPTLVILAACWTALLVIASGITQDTWYLVAICGVGFLQNIMAADLPCTPGELGFDLEPYKPCPSIVGFQRTPDAKLETKTKELSEKDMEKFDAQTEVRDVMGTLMELEKHFPKAGAALLPVFYPGDGAGWKDWSKTGWEKDFWERIAKE